MEYVYTFLIRRRYLRHRADPNGCDQADSAAGFSFVSGGRGSPAGIASI